MKEKNTHKIVIELGYNKGSNVADNIKITSSATVVDLMLAAMRLWGVASQKVRSEGNETIVELCARTFEGYAKYLDIIDNEEDEEDSGEDYDE